MSALKNNTIPLQVLFYLFLGFTFLWFGPVFMLEMGIKKYLIFFVSTIPSFALLGVTFLRSNKSFDPFEPLNFVLATLFLGTTLRCYYLLTTSPFGERQSVLLYGQSTDFLIYPAIYISFAMMFLILGYYPKIKHLKLDSVSSVFTKTTWNSKRVWILIGVISVISIIGAVVFFQKVGLEELTIETFSKKRRTYLDEGRTQRVSYGYYRWAASLIKFPYYLALIHFANSGKKFMSKIGFVVFFLAILAMLFPIMTSLRSELIYVLANTLIIWYYLRGFPYVLFSISIPAVFLVVYGMLLLRTNDFGKDYENRKETSGAVIIEALVGSANMLGIAKTGHIIHGVPSKMDYAYGGSFMTLVFAPIPRTMWHEKPYMNPGATIKQKVLPDESKDIMGGGIPPGSVAEMYWNFGIFGVTLGMFLIGRVIKFVYKTFRPWLSINPNALFIYICFILQLSFVLTGDSFSQATLQAIQNIIPAFLILKYLNGKKFSWRLRS